jgi:hypothetical protein
MSDFAALSIEGRVATPADSDWDDARRAWNLVVDQHPSAVAFVESAADVSTVVRFAGDRGWAGDGGYFNFAERPADVEDILPPDTVALLREVKRRWDPDAMIRANHEASLAPA